MSLEELIKDKGTKSKAKVTKIGEWLLRGELRIDELLAFTSSQNSVNKATCIEAIEYATKKIPGIAEESLLVFVSGTLKDEEPRVKWESAKVIGNIAKLFPTMLSKPVKNLLANADQSKTVVRWATAYALSEILKLKTSLNKKLVPIIEKLYEKEQDGGVKKKYLEALTKLKQ